MKHLNLELEKLEQRIAPGGLPTGGGEAPPAGVGGAGLAARGFGRACQVGVAEANPGRTTSYPRVHCPWPARQVAPPLGRPTSLAGIFRLARSAQLTAALAGDAAAAIRTATALVTSAVFNLTMSASPLDVLFISNVTWSAAEASWQWPYCFWKRPDR